MSAHVETPSYVWQSGKPVLATPDLAPWDRPFLTWKGPDYEIKEEFSPSGLQTWGECEHKGALRYVLGIREFEFTWAMLAGRPSPTHSNKRTQARLVKIFNKRRGPALGKASHGILEQHFRSHLTASASCDPSNRVPPVSKVQWKTLPGRVALSGLGLLPDPEQCAWLDVEGQLQLTSAIVLPKMEPIIFNGFRDLLAAFRNSRLRLYDYKTTSDVQYIKGAAELALGEQASIYSLDVLAWQHHYQLALECSWVYFLTKGNPYAERVDFEMPRSVAETNVRGLSLFADSIRTKMRKYGADLDAYPKNPEHCPQFGGCAMHVDRGGPCDAKASFVSRLAQLSRKPSIEQRKEREKNIMGFREQRAAATAAAGPAGDGVNAPEGDQPGAPDDGAAAQPAAAAPRGRGRPPANAAAGAPATPAAPRGRPPAGARAAAAAPAASAAAASDDQIRVVYGSDDAGESLIIAPSTPLYARLSKLHQVNFG